MPGAASPPLDVKPNIKGKAKKPDPNTLSIKVSDIHGQTMIFTIKKNTKLTTVRDMFAARTGEDPLAFQLLFMGSG